LGLGDGRISIEPTRHTKVTCLPLSGIHLSWRADLRPLLHSRHCKALQRSSSACTLILQATPTKPHPTKRPCQAHVKKVSSKPPILKTLKQTLPTCLQQKKRPQPPLKSKTLPFYHFTFHPNPPIPLNEQHITFTSVAMRPNPGPKKREIRNGLYLLQTCL
jgi:hypothetical protein